MSNIEKIRKEIERQRSFIEGLFIEGDNNFYDGQDDAYNHLLSFIDSLPEEKHSEDLEEAARQYTQEMLESWKFDSTGVRPIREPFIAGAEWQKEQMMKGAVEGVVCYGSKGAYVESDWLGTTDVEVYGDSGDKVKIIIVKQ